MHLVQQPPGPRIDFRPQEGIDVKILTPGMSAAIALQFEHHLRLRVGLCHSFGYHRTDLLRQGVCCDGLPGALGAKQAPR